MRVLYYRFATRIVKGRHARKVVGADGMANSVLARRLRVSSAAIRNHSHNILARRPQSVGRCPVRHEPAPDLAGADTVSGARTVRFRTHWAIPAERVFGGMALRPTRRGRWLADTLA